MKGSHLMAAPKPECNPCKALALTLTAEGLRHWVRQDDGDSGRHYMTTHAALRWRQSAPDERVEALRDRIVDIDAAGQVAWVDLRDSDIVVYQAPHGMIPRGIPRPT
jgi:hypothetical protein